MAEAEALGLNDQGYGLETGLSTASGSEKLPRGDCSLRRNAEQQMEATRAEAVRARKIVELAFNVSLHSCSFVELQRAVEVSVRVGIGSGQR
jgi:hypothetical protein